MTMINTNQPTYIVNKLVLLVKVDESTRYKWVNESEDDLGLIVCLVYMAIYKWRSWISFLLGKFILR